MHRALTGLILSLLALAASAQTPPPRPDPTIRLDFADPGDRSAWIGPAESVNPPADAIRGDGTTLEVPLGSANDRDRVYVVDHRANGMASRPVSQARTGWKLTEKDWTRLFEVTVRVESQGRPVANASVRARVGEIQRTELLVPGSEGRVVFRGLPVGTLRLDAVYLADAESRTTPTREYALKVGGGVPGFIVNIDDRVTTLPSGAPGAPQQNGPANDRQAKTPDAKASPPAPRGSAAQTLVTLLLGLAVIGGAGYAAYAFWKRHPEKVQDTLQKVGIGDPGAAADPVPAAVPVAPDPLRPIVLPDASPTAAATTVPAFVPGSATADPRLVAEGGAPVAIPEGESQIGREDGLTFSVPGETSVSRRHAALVRQGQEVTLRDLGSTNGTYLNGVRLQSEATLRPGDTIQCGNRRFRYEVG